MDVTIPSTTAPTRHLPIQSLPHADRPREKLLNQGPHTLTDAELLAIFLRTGVQGRSAVQIGEDLITHFGSLAELLEADLAQLKQFKGLGQAKAAQLFAVLELGKRYLAAHLRETPTINASSTAKAYVQSYLREQKREQFFVMYLNQQHQLIESEVLFEGTVNEARVYPRELVKAVLAKHATTVIIAHNHPSGVAQPSEADKQITQKLIAALALVDVQMLDHLIVAGNSVFSFAEHGLLSAN